MPPKLWQTGKKCSISFLLIPQNALARLPLHSNRPVGCFLLSWILMGTRSKRHFVDIVCKAEVNDNGDDPFVVLDGG